MHNECLSPTRPILTLQGIDHCAQLEHTHLARGEGLDVVQRALEEGQEVDQTGGLAEGCCEALQDEQRAIHLPYVLGADVGHERAKHLQEGVVGRGKGV